MPIPEQRDQEASRAALSVWFATALGAEGPVELSPFRGPGANGYSNETIITDARWRSAGQEHEETFVVRVAPTGYALFPDAAFDVQQTLLRALAATPVPVPEVRFSETDAAVLGAPFFVMGFVPGLVPGDAPSYHAEGWLKDAPAAVQERVWWGQVDTLVELHGLDWRALGLGFLDVPDAGLVHQLRYYEEFLLAVEKQEEVPVAREALEWLQSHLPAGHDDPSRLVLSWGDARIGNILYSAEGERLAVVDWEMVALGEPEMDLAWGLFLDRSHSEAQGVPRLPGLPSREATVARYEAATGKTLENMGFYEVFAGFRFCVIMARLAAIFKDWGLLPADHDMARDNHVVHLTRTVLAEQGA